MNTYIPQNVNCLQTTIEERNEKRKEKTQNITSFARMAITYAEEKQNMKKKSKIIPVDSFETQSKFVRSTLILPERFDSVVQFCPRLLPPPPPALRSQGQGQRALYCSPAGGRNRRITAVTSHQFLAAIHPHYVCPESVLLLLWHVIRDASCRSASSTTVV